MKMVRQLAIIILVLGAIGVVLGGVFIGEGFSKNKLITTRMATENVSLATDPNNPQILTRVTNAASAQEVADKIAADRRAIAPTYQALLNGGRFDYLYMAVMAFGLVQSVLGSGAYMVVTGLAVFLLGLALFRLGGQKAV
jgi:anaerobic selenocysteine-containing dehydrogenase